MSDTQNNILTKGLQSSLTNTAIVDGTLRYTTDTGRLYLDVAPEGSTPVRLKIGDIEDSYTEQEIFDLLTPLPKLYISSDTHKAYVSTTTEWIDISAINLKVSETKDADQPIWFSTTADEDEKPVYSDNLSFNTNSNTLKSSNVTVSNTLQVGTLKITDSLNTYNNKRIIDFSF